MPVKEARNSTLGRGNSKDKGIEACKSGPLPIVGSKRH